MSNKKFSILFKDLDNLDLEEKYLKIKSWLKSKTRDPEDLRKAVSIAPEMARQAGILYAMVVAEEDIYNLKTESIISRILLKAEKELLSRKKRKEIIGQLTETKLKRFIYAEENEEYLKIMRIRARKKRNSLILLALKNAVDARWHLLQTQSKFLNKD